MLEPSLGACLHTFEKSASVTAAQHENRVPPFVSWMVPCILRATRVQVREPLWERRRTPDDPMDFLYSGWLPNTF